MPYRLHSSRISFKVIRGLLAARGRETRGDAGSAAASDSEGVYLDADGEREPLDPLETEMTEGERERERREDNGEVGIPWARRPSISKISSTSCSSSARVMVE